jgi:alkanesulfonate monooxygenase SsuD/methylene tetrahydromethanopterin reductase-like flavin-dependent oxidoreductase (luciferase family)
VNLNGLKFETDLIGGHKTGMYLDQQTNYQAVAQFAKGAQVLDCFSFLGGFGLHAARAGAAHVHFLDQSAEAIEASKRNAVTNGLADKCSFDAINVFDWLKHNTAPNNVYYPPEIDGQIADGRAIVGTPAKALELLRGQLAESGANYLVCRFAFGDLSLSESMRSLELFQRHVMPALRESVPVLLCHRRPPRVPLSAGSPGTGSHRFGGAL